MFFLTYLYLEPQGGSAIQNVVKLAFKTEVSQALGTSYSEKKTEEQDSVTKTVFLSVLGVGNVACQESGYVAPVKNTRGNPTDRGDVLGFVHMCFLVRRSGGNPDS